MSSGLVFNRASSDHRIVRVAVADDHPLLLAGLIHELQTQPDIRIIGTAGSSPPLLDLLQKHTIDVVIADHDIPGGNSEGSGLFGVLRQRFAHLALIALTAVSNIHVIRSLLAQDVHCILSKSDPLVYLSTSVCAALAGKRYLPPSIEAIVRGHGFRYATSGRRRDLSVRELEVVRLFVSGFTINEIARRLQRSKQTVSAQKMSAMRKLGMRRNADLIKYGVEEQLTSYNFAFKSGANARVSNAR